jgi:hypothetical protein
MTTISTKQVLDFVLEQISKDFTIDHDTLKNKFSSLDNIYNSIQESINANERVIKKVTIVEAHVVAKKRVIRKVSKDVEEPIVTVEVEPIVNVEPVVTVEVEPIVTVEPVAIAPTKKKVIRKVTKVVEEPTEVTVQHIVVPIVVAEEPKPEVVLTAKKKVIRKVTKVVEEPIVVPSVVPTSVVAEEPKPEVVLTAKKKVIRKNTKLVEKPVEEPVEEKVLPKRVEKVVAETKKKSKKNVELVEFGTDANSVEGVDEIEANVYVDTMLYDDEEIVLKLYEINDNKYFIDDSNYVYDFKTKDFIGKLSEKGDTIIVLTDFPTKRDDTIENN